MNFLKKSLAVCTFALSVVLAPLSANAAPIELALVIDGSGSISNAQWQLQMQGYANAINNVLPTDGTVAVSVIQFSTNAVVELGMTEINSVADRDSLSNFMLGINHSKGWTCISCGIVLAEETFTGTAERAVIDISTDGFWNRGVNPNGDENTVGTSAWAVENGNATVVNAIGIGIGTEPDFNYGEDSFSMLANSFEDFQWMIEEKIRREITPVPVPEPGALALMALGLFGLGAARMRRQSA